MNINTENVIDFLAMIYYNEPNSSTQLKRPHSGSNRHVSPYKKRQIVPPPTSSSQRPTTTTTSSSADHTGWFLFKLDSFGKQIDVMLLR